jgi:hypothetical protein
MLNRFGKAIKSKVKTKLGRGELTPVEGLPPGIDFETVSRICQHNFGEFVRRTSYLHISGWLQAGKYRLFLETRSTRLLQLVFKEVIVDEEHIPPLSTIRIVPGPSECAIYRSGSSQLLRYLPAVYLCDEITPQKHYRYILEDLQLDYRKPSTKDDIYLISRQLPKIHLAMKEWLESGGEDELIRYEGTFAESLHKFMIETIDALPNKKNSEILKRIQFSWKRIMQMLDRKNFVEFIPMRPVHGDFNTTNIRIHNKNADEIKLIDWEWAGIGVPHTDLASLLMSAPRQVEEEAMHNFFRHIKGWTLEDQIKLYWSCKLERGLLDAAFLSAHENAASGVTSIDYRKSIEYALKLATEALDNLE